MSEVNRRHEKPEFDQGAFDDAFLRADYAECRRLVKGQRDRDVAVILEARLNWREQHYVAMIEPLSELKSKDRDIALERDVLLGAAYGCTKDYATGRLRLDRVLEQGVTGRLLADALFYKSLVAWMEQEHRESEAIANELRKSGKPLDTSRADIILSWIAIRRRDVKGHIAYLTSALDTLESTPEPDAYYRAKALMTLALLARELPLPDLVQRVRKSYEAMNWEQGTRLPQFQTTRFIGWIDALQGDELSAFKAFRAAMALAPSDHWRVLCLTDRAYLAFNTGETSFANELLHDAHEVAQSLEWQDTADEERSALIVLAELFAPSNPAIAQHYLAKFRSLSTSVLPGLSYGTDPRVRAFAEYSSGIALLQLGESAEAANMLSDALHIFDGFGYGWRSALCALGLHQATGEASWLAEARRKIAPWPQSWIARRVRAADDPAETKLLSRAQREVLNLLLDGKSNAAIAKALGRSPYTVRNHISQLFKVCGVTNRTELAGLFRAAKPI